MYLLEISSEGIFRKPNTSFTNSPDKYDPRTFYTTYLLPPRIENERSVRVPIKTE